MVAGRGRYLWRWHWFYPNESKRMIHAQPYITLPEVVPQAELQAWKEKMLERSQNFTAPPEVRSFIKSIANKLGDFAPFRSSTVLWRGRDLAINEYGGKKIIPHDLYPVDIPVLQAVDHYTTMMLIYKKRGKQGLIDFCKVKVKGSELERVLEILNVHVFHEERPEFKQVLREIDNAKKLEAA